MARYTKASANIPLREDDMLVETVFSKEEGRVPGTFDVVAPGLYPGEETFTLDDGTLIALKVETHWIPSGRGISFHTLARAIEADGSTILTEEDQPVTAGFSATIPAVQVLEHGVDAIATDVARIVLGEDPKIMVDVPMGEGLPTKKVPLLDLSTDVRTNANIRAQMKLVAQVRKAPVLSL